MQQNEGELQETINIVNLNQNTCTRMRENYRKL